MKTDSPKKIKAFLLAAGLGTRLRPITDTIPKCLVPIGNKPLLGHWMESLIQAGVGEALVNTHWLALQVEAFAKDWNASNLVLKTFYEPELLGSAGTIAANAQWASDADAALVIYADNFSRFDLRRLLGHHFATRSELTLGVFTAPDPCRCGIVEVDAEGRGLSFEEKPTEPKSNLAAAGLYVLSPDIVREIRALWHPGQGVFDLGFDLFPHLVRRATVFPITEPLIDIGTIEAYERVCREYQTFNH
jgi:mannose-1-phosphate guanylyltransferase